MSRDGLANLATLSYYILIVNRMIGSEDLGAYMQDHLGAEAKDAVLTAGERLIQKGRIEGRIEGRNEGRNEGKAIGARRSVLAVFEARSLTVPDDVQQRIQKCADIDTLERWLQRAVVVESAADIFEA